MDKQRPSIENIIKTQEEISALLMRIIESQQEDKIKENQKKEIYQSNSHPNNMILQQQPPAQQTRSIFGFSPPFNKDSEKFNIIAQSVKNITAALNHKLEGKEKKDAKVTASLYTGEVASKHGHSVSQKNGL